LACHKKHSSALFLLQPCYTTTQEPTHRSNKIRDHNLVDANSGTPKQGCALPAHDSPQTSRLSGASAETVEVLLPSDSNFDHHAHTGIAMHLPARDTVDPAHRFNPRRAATRSPCRARRHYGGMGKRTRNGPTPSPVLGWRPFKMLRNGSVQLKDK